MKKEYFYYLLITLAFVIMATFNACKPKPEPEPNTPGSVSVTTSSVSNITETSAKCGGTVTASGYSVGNCGLCYSELPNPTINSYITSDQMGTGTFTSTMSGLEPGTKYYVRAYATTSSRTLYGEQKEFTTKSNNGGDDDDDDDNGGGNGGDDNGGNDEGDDDEYNIPTVISSNQANSITNNSATFFGNVTDDGGSIITARGVCWSTSKEPTIEDAHTTNGIGLGYFKSILTNLSENTIYYVRAYATNKKGTAYGEVSCFHTSGWEEEYTGNINNHKYIDLGLSSGIKWATRNIGSSSVEGSGGFYAWGETTTKSEYNITNSVTFKKYVYEFSGNEKYDAACANWKGSWRMPTEEEAMELLDECICIPTSKNNKKGYMFIGPNGNKMFLPASGEKEDSDLENSNIRGYYWTSSPLSVDSEHFRKFATAINFINYIDTDSKSKNPAISTMGFRHRGYPIRPVSN